MNKTQLIDAISAATDLPKNVAGRALEATLDSIMKALIEDDQVALVGFGTFGVKLRAARTGRNPKTGGSLMIPEAKVAYFKAGKVLKDAVNGGELPETDD